MISCRFCFSLLLLTFAVLILTQAADSEEGTISTISDISTPSNAASTLSTIYSLEENCEAAICRNFYYPDISNVAFFDLKQNIRFLDDETYEVQKPIKTENLVFLNSTFAHFPLHLFYSIGVNELDIRNCSIEIVTWESFLQANKLQILLLSSNKLQAIGESTFSYAYELQYLFLDDNQLRLLHDDSFKGLKKLRYLNLSFNRLRELPGLIFSDLESLYEINLAGNRLNYLPNQLFERNKQLQVVVLRENKLRQVDEYLFKNQPNLMFLDISNNQRLGRLILNVNTKYLNAANCSLYLINLYGDIVNADLRDNQIVELYFSQPESLEKLVLRNNKLQQIASLAKAINLHELNVADNPGLEYLPEPWSVNSLERLDLSNTSLKALPISNLAEQTHLHSLNISNNKIQEINPQSFKYLEQLTHFYIDANDWNCYNLRVLMDFLIKPNRISYKPDNFDIDFPGEYIEGIACMYRIEEAQDSNEMEKSSSTNSNSKGRRLMLNEEMNASLNLPIATTAGNSFETTNEYPTGGNTVEQKLRQEIQTLRNELKAIITFYESKFDVVFNKMEKLDQRLAAFESMNETMFQHITIST